MSTETVTTEGSDPLKAVADAMAAAVETAEDGVNRVRATAADAQSAYRARRRPAQAEGIRTRQII